MAATDTTVKPVELAKQVLEIRDMILSADTDTDKEES